MTTQEQSSQTALPWSVGATYLLARAPIIGAIAGLVASLIAGAFSAGFDWIVVVSLSAIIGAIATTVGAAIAVLLKFFCRAWGRGAIVDFVCSLTGLGAVWTGVWALVFVGQRGWNPLLVIGLPSIVGTVVFTFVLGVRRQHSNRQYGSD